MIIWAIDPGTVESGVIVYESESRRFKHSTVKNPVLLSHIKKTNGLVIIEKLGGGRMIGLETLETAVWIGRFMQASVRFIRIPRSTILRYFNVLKKDGPFHELKTTDARIRHLMIQRWNTTELTGDAWQALALLSYFLDNDKHGEIDDKSFNC